MSNVAEQYTVHISIDGQWRRRKGPRRTRHDRRTYFYGDGRKGLAAAFRVCADQLEHTNRPMWKILDELRTGPTPLADGETWVWEEYEWERE